MARRFSSRKAANQPQYLMRPIAGLKPCPTNPKIHDENQIAALARSITTFGLNSPLIAKPDGELIAGHARLEAAKRLGLSEVPVVVIDHLTPEQVRAYRIADNRLAEIGAGWSMDLLKIEVASILEIDAGFDLGLTGFELADLNLSLDVTDSKEEPAEPAVPEVEAFVVTRFGDVWEIGDHRLICGDATKPEAYAQLFGRERAAMVIADAPYNVPIEGHVSGLGKAKHREFVQGSGELSPAEFQQFLTRYMMQCARFARSGALHYHFMDWRGLPALLAAGQIAYDEYKQLCVWVKSQGGMGSHYRSQHELIAVFKHGKAPHTNNVMLGKHGRNRTTVWSYAGMNTFGHEGDEALALHPTVKPIAMIRDAILDASNRDQIVLDPFGGSGTTLLAADLVKRRARLIELDPRYCDVIVRRAERTLGLSATLMGTSRTFAEMAVERETPNG